MVTGGRTSARRAQLIQEVTERLGPVSGHLDDDAFAALVERVVRLTLKYEGSATPTPATQRAVRPEPEPRAD